MRLLKPSIVLLLFFFFLQILKKQVFVNALNELLYIDEQNNFAYLQACPVPEAYSPSSSSLPLPFFTMPPSVWTLQYIYKLLLSDMLTI